MFTRDKGGYGGILRRRCPIITKEVTLIGAKT
jgi:hypothetical protein